MIRSKAASIFSAACLAMVGVGCAATPDATGEDSEELLGPTHVITNCTGSAVSAAVAAGGDLLLNCGPAPITIAMPPTAVTSSTRLQPAFPHTITFVHAGSLFDVAANVSFEVDNFKFDGTGFSGIALHGDPLAGPATLVANGDSFSHYSSFAIAIGGGTLLTVSNSTFDSNGSASSSFAAPIYNEASRAIITGSTFSNNQGVGQGGAITGVGSSGAGANFVISNSTFVNNAAGFGGAISTTLNATITNCTFVMNRASSSASAIRAVAPVTILNSTFYDNFPTVAVTGNVVMTGSILVNVTAGPCSIAGASNLQWPATGSLCGPGFHVGDPKLSGLASNGGPTQTLALLPGSAAIDTDFSACPTTDQRGFPRPRDGDGNGSIICDLGAYER